MTNMTNRGTLSIEEAVSDYLFERGHRITKPVILDIQEFIIEHERMARLDTLIWATGGIKEFTDEGKTAIPQKISELRAQGAAKPK